MEQFNLQNEYKIYAKLNANKNIIAVNSSAFLENVDEWVLIDSGFGDKYHHAQGNYFDGGIFTHDGISLYHWDGVQVIKRTDEEIETERRNIPPAPMTTEELSLDLLTELNYRTTLLELGMTT